MRKKIIFCFLVIFLVFSSYIHSQTDIVENKNINSEASTTTLYEVSVVGHVDKPGTYNIYSGTRLDQILHKSIKDSTKLNPSIRNIALKRENKTLHFDLLRFLRLADPINNPYLNDGDIIIVCPIEKTVTISGAINMPGTYELLSGDRILNIIELTMGTKPRAYLKQAEIVRFINSSNSTTTIKIELEKILDNPKCEENILLQDDDRIFIRSIPEYHKKKGVEVDGEVKFPGFYAIEEGESTLSEVIAKAGGPTKFADLENAYLRRRSGNDILDPEFERLKKVPVEEMTNIEYEYFKTKSREMKGKFAIDFENLLSDSINNNVLLKNNDYIFFPDLSKTVYVSGTVKNPGLVNYIEGKNYFYYLEKAGGFAWRARRSKIRLVKANTGEWLEPDENTKIEVGDMIFVPEKSEINYWKITKDFLAALGEIATIIIVIQNVR